MSKRLHLLWFLAGYQPRGWFDPRYGTGHDFRKAGHYIAGAQAIERACFDGVLVADQPSINDSYGSGDLSRQLRSGYESICGDPMNLLAFMGAHTKHIGLIGTFSTTYHPPFLLARQLNALDHLTEGRAGWNIVTSAHPNDGKNFGVALPEHDDRYDMGDEHVDLVKALCNSWEQDAVLLDRENGVFADPSKVHPVNFEGERYRSQGPLPFPRSPQGTPVLAQAGASGRGREFGARNAELIMGNQNSTAGMKDYVTDVKARGRKSYGREPKVFFNIQPVIGETHEIAEERMSYMKESAKHRVIFDAGLAFASASMGIDLSIFDLDIPVLKQIEAIDQNKRPASGSIISQYAMANPEFTPRDLGEHEGLKMTLPLVGTAEEVADQMCEIAEETGADGFLFRESMHPAYLADICDGLVPALQRRGAMRTEYSGGTFREVLNEY
jgi:FMN-dependent oxidoreductase (nitrilotriacetate monooxygenase family)